MNVKFFRSTLWSAVDWQNICTFIYCATSNADLFARFVSYLCHASLFINTSENLLSVMTNLQKNILLKLFVQNKESVPWRHFHRCCPSSSRRRGRRSLSAPRGRDRSGTLSSGQPHSSRFNIQLKIWFVYHCKTLNSINLRLIRGLHLHEHCIRLRILLMASMAST